MSNKICAICGEEFTPRPYNRSVCYKDHYHPCPVCGKDVLCNEPKRQTCTCSRECGAQVANKSRVNNLLASRGVSNVSELPEVRQKISNALRGRPKSQPQYSTCATCGKTFQLKWPYDQKTCSKECRSTYVKTSGISKARTAKAHKTIQAQGFKDLRELQRSKTYEKTCKYCGKQFSTHDPRQEYCSDPHYGPCPVCGESTRIYDLSIGPQSCSDQCKQKLRETTCEARYGNKCVLNSDHGKAKARLTSKVKYGTDFYQQTQEFHTKYGLSKYSVKSSDGLIFDNKYELSVYEFLKPLELDISRQIPFDYQYNGARKLLIDFEIDGRLFECKGGHFITGTYIQDNVQLILKLQLYHQHHAPLITDRLGFEAIKNHEDEIVRQSTCIDIELFRGKSNLNPLDTWNRLCYLIDSGVQFIDIATFNDIPMGT